MDIQTIDYRWFIENLDSLYREYGNLFIAIKNQKVLGSYPSYADGVKETAKTEKLGTFIVQQCAESETALLVRITSVGLII